MSKRLFSAFAIALLVVAMLGVAGEAQTSLSPRDSAPLQTANRPASKAAAAPAAPVKIVDADHNKIFDNLEARLQGTAPGAAFDVIVQFAGPPAADAFPQMFARVGQFPVTARWDVALQGFAATLTRAQIEGLARLPFVKQVEDDLEVHVFLNTATSWTGVQKARADFGVTGDRDGSPTTYSSTDVVIAIIDTGIDAAHVDLDGGKVIGWRDEISGKTTPYDDNGHGTHVSSIAAGTGEGNPAYRGVAPGAALVGIKVLNKQGSGTSSGIINGINWMIANKATYGIRIANMSLGSSGCSDGTDSLSTAVNNAVDNSIIMVVAAGNSGPAKCTIGAPAAAAKAITVGASYDPGELGWALAEFSSRGPTADGRVKPDVVTPGRYITAAQAGSTNGYVTYSGTSMATPFMAGVAGLMLDANYALTDAGVKNIVYGAGNYEDWGPAAKDVDYGYGLNLSYNSVKAAGGFTGSYDDGIAHGYASGSLGGTGQSQSWNLTVSSTTAPIAITMIIPNWTSGLFGGSPDFDLYLYDPSGALVGRSEGVTRQELIRFQPTATGTYTVEVYSYSGSGSYFFDTSYR